MSRKTKAAKQPKFAPSTSQILNVNNDFTQNALITDAEKSAVIQMIMQMNTVKLGTLIATLVDVRVLDIDCEYQRVQTSNIGSLVDKFDIEQTGVIELSYRDGHLYIVDGAHRTMGALMNGHKYLLALIHTGWTQAQEAEAFKRQLDNIETIKPIEMYRAGLVANDPACQMLQTICDKHSLTVCRGTKGITQPMTAIKAALDIIENHNMDSASLDWTFDLMKKAHWLKCRNAAIARHVSGLSAGYDEAASRNKLTEATERLLAVMKKTNPDEFDSYAKLKYSQLEIRSGVEALVTDIINGEVTTREVLVSLNRVN